MTKITLTSELLEAVLSKVKNVEWLGIARRR
jgi:hypothetical protein